MVGGFAKSLYMERQIRAFAQGLDMEVIKPADA
jgi:hypothetical protein